MGRWQIIRYAGMTMLIVAGLAYVWEIMLEGGGVLPDGLAHSGETMTSHWVHIGLITVFASIGVGIMAYFSLNLIHELKLKERLMQRSEDERLSFAADAAHELRTPLAILHAHIDSLDATDTTRQLRADVEQISRIIEQVLAKTRVEALEVKPGDTADLAMLCTNLAAYMAPLVIKEGRSIEVLGAEHPVVINANIFALEQALRNLVENAIKYSARGSTVTIELVQQAKEHQLRVIDRGRGIPEKDRELIFERFHRADRRGAGSGLGLSIVRRVAESHGGTIAVEDAPEGGSVFVLTFPHRKK